MEPRPIALRPMREDDLDAVLAIDEGTNGIRALRERQLREEFTRPWARLTVAVSETGLVHAYVLAWHVTDEIHILNVAVAPDVRRRGIGRLLVDAVVAYGRVHHAAKVLLEVRASNDPARRLYEAVGFERFNVRRGYYDDGEDGVEMMLCL